MKIIQAKISHVPYILVLWKELMDYHRALDPYYTRRRDAVKNFEKFLRIHLKDAIQSDTARVVIAFEGKEAVGFAMARIEPDIPVFKRQFYGFIDTFGVKAEYRRKGVGDRMLKNLLAWFRKKGMDNVELRVAAKNQIGYSFWTRHGFEDKLRILHKELK